MSVCVEEIMVGGERKEGAEGGGRLCEIGHIGKCQPEIPAFNESSLKKKKKNERMGHGTCHMPAKK